MARKTTLHDFERPSLAVDVVALTVPSGGGLFVSLYRRDRAPFRGAWALPGGFVRIDETIDDAAARLLRDKGGQELRYLEQLYTFGDLGRDPRGRVVTVAYFALTGRVGGPPSVAGKVCVPWSGETGGAVTVVDEAGDDMPLAFDHDMIIGLAVKRLRGKLDYTPVGFQLLPEKFALRDLQHIHEVIRGEPINKDSFRRRMLMSGLLEATGERERDVPYRPAELYRFVRRSAT